MPNSPETILIFCAHPDDEILGVGGTAAKYSQEGKKVISVIFSKGEKSHFWMQEQHVHDVRTQESLVAGAIVGVSDTVFLGLRDSKLKTDCQDPVVKERIKSIITNADPVKIFTHDQDDFIYPDHIGVHRVVVEAVDELIAQERFKGELYTFNIWFMHLRKRDRPKLVVDISSTFHKKRRALKAFGSQKLALLQLIPFTYAKAFFDGIDSGHRYAETFYKVR